MFGTHFGQERGPTSLRCEKTVRPTGSKMSLLFGSRSKTTKTRKSYDEERERDDNTCAVCCAPIACCSCCMSCFLCRGRTYSQCCLLWFNSVLICLGLMCIGVGILGFNVSLDDLNFANPILNATQARVDSFRDFMNSSPTFGLVAGIALLAIGSLGVVHAIYIKWPRLHTAYVEALLIGSILIFFLLAWAAIELGVFDGAGAQDHISEGTSRTYSVLQMVVACIVVSLLLTGVFSAAYYLPSRLGLTLLGATTAALGVAAYLASMSMPEAQPDYATADGNAGGTGGISDDGDCAFSCLDPRVALQLVGLLIVLACALATVFFIDHTIRRGCTSCQDLARRRCDTAAMTGFIAALVASICFALYLIFVVWVQRNPEEVSERTHGVDPGSYSLGSLLALAVLLGFFAVFALCVGCLFIGYYREEFDFSGMAWLLCVQPCCVCLTCLGVRHRSDDDKAHTDDAEAGGKTAKSAKKEKKGEVGVTL